MEKRLKLFIYVAVVIMAVPALSVWTGVFRFWWYLVYCVCALSWVVMESILRRWGINNPGRSSIYIFTLVLVCITFSCAVSKYPILDLNLSDASQSPVPSS